MEKNTAGIMITHYLKCKINQGRKAFFCAWQLLCTFAKAAFTVENPEKFGEQIAKVLEKAYQVGAENSGKNKGKIPLQ